MSEEDDILGKMDALLKRHQPATPADGEIPVLTEVVVATRNEAAPIPVLTEIVSPHPANPLEASPPEAGTAQPREESLPSGDLIQQLAPLLNDWLERNLPGRLDALTAHIELRVREVVAQELQKHLDTLSEDYARLREAGRGTSPGGTSDNGDSV
jgi:hypothetical protein